MGTDTNIGRTDEHARQAAEALELPFAWERQPDEAGPAPRGTLFRFPTADDPGPGTRRLLVMAIYGSVLGLLGLAVAVRGIVAIIGDAAPGWYQPTLGAAATAEVALVAGAFLSIHRRFLPWLLLVAAAAPLAVNIVATMRAV